MSLEQKITDFLAAADTLPAKSKLEPFAELIRALRRKRWTYRRIAVTLREEFGVTVAASTVHNFLSVRARRKLDPVEKPAATTPPTVPVVVAKRPRFHLDA